MKLQFKHQKFQADAAKAVCDEFAGQPFLTSSYMIDKGTAIEQRTLFEFTGFDNACIVPEPNEILENIQKIQHKYQIEPSKTLEGIASEQA